MIATIVLPATDTRGKVWVAIGVGQWLEYTTPAYFMLGTAVQLQAVPAATVILNIFMNISLARVKINFKACCSSLQRRLVPYGFGLRLLKLKRLPQQKAFGRAEGAFSTLLFLLQSRPLSLIWKLPAAAYPTCRPTPVANQKNQSIPYMSSTDNWLQINPFHAW